jgi:DNA-binding response OmpR family regulator
MPTHYIAKPFRINELLARLRAQLREFDSEDATFSIGPYTFHPSKKLLRDAATARRKRALDPGTMADKHGRPQRLC